MLYREIIMSLKDRANYTVEELAKAVGLRSQQALSQRLKDSWNPGMKDAQAILGKLGYKIVFVPSATKVNEDWFEPEFPERPQKNQK